jgi:hypothetical protein
MAEQLIEKLKQLEAEKAKLEEDLLKVHNAKLKEGLIAVLCYPIYKTTHYDQYEKTTDINYWKGLPEGLRSEVIYVPEVELYKYLGRIYGNQL